MNHPPRGTLLHLFGKTSSLVTVFAILVLTSAPAQADHKWTYVGNLIEKKGESVTSLAANPGGSVIAISFEIGSTNNAHIELVDPKGTVLRSLEKPPSSSYHNFRDLEFSPNGALIYGWATIDQYVHVWNVADGKYLGKYGDGSYGGIGLGLNPVNPDANTFNSSSTSGSLKPMLLAHAGGGSKTNTHIRSANNIKIGSLKAGANVAMDFDYAPSGSFFSVGGRDGYAYIVSSGSRAGTWQVEQLKPSMSGGVIAVDVDSASQWVAVGGGIKDVYAFNLGSRKLQKLSGHTDVMRDVVFSAYSNYLVSGSWDNTAKIWNTSTWKLEDTLSHGSGVQAVGMSQDRDMTTVYTGGSNGVVKIWRKANPTPTPTTPTSPSPTPSTMPTPTPSAAPTPSSAPTPKPTPESSVTPLPTTTFLPTPSPTPTMPPIITPTPSPTPTYTPPITPTPSPTPTVTMIPIITPTPSPTPTLTTIPTVPL